MIEKQMLKLLLGKKFYTQYKGQVSRSVFQGSFGALVNSLKTLRKQQSHRKRLLKILLISWQKEMWLNV